MGRRAIALYVVLLAALMTSNSARTARRELEDRVSGVDRFVDVGVNFMIVATDPAGVELVRGCPPMRVIDTIRRGGILDTALDRPSIIGPSLRPRDWYCSEDQATILFSKSERFKTLVKGSEGAGKTRLMAYWHYLGWLISMGNFDEWGQTAPTMERLGGVKGEMLASWGSNWIRWRERDDFTGFELADGCHIRFRYTHKQSEAKGSPIQTYNWVRHAGDEAQDSVEAHADITMRGRSAPGGRYAELRTATAKDSPDWRTLRDQLEASGFWDVVTLLGTRSPFVWPSHWESARRMMSPREAARRIDCLDLPPESATYPDWSREHGLITIPQIGWTDVTELELARMNGPNLGMLVGHDPGLTIDVSLLGQAFVPNLHLQAYRRELFRPWWVIRGEVNTEQSTTEAHIGCLLSAVQDESWLSRPHGKRFNLLVRDDRTGRYRPPGVNDAVPQILVRADPAGNNDNRTDKTVYTQFANAGIRIRPAAYNATNDGHGRVPREAGVELVNTLIKNAAGERRLFVERLPDGRPAAPRLVAALESSERDHAGRAEHRGFQIKGKGDMTHWPACLRYMLWAIERPRLKLTAREDAT